MWSIVVVGVWLCLIGATVAASGALGWDIKVCAFRGLSGRPCPTCGMTRGVLSMLRGQIVAGWACNPLMFTLLGVAAAVVLMRVAFGRKLELQMSRRQRRIAWALFIVLALLNWAYLIRYVG